MDPFPAACCADCLAPLSAAPAIAGLLGVVSATACGLSPCSLRGLAALQLRNLVWATSKHDVYTMHDNCVKHWSGITRQQTEVGLCSPKQGVSLGICLEVLGSVNPAC